MSGTASGQRNKATVNAKAQHVQYPDRPAIRQLIRHEAHRPCFIGFFRHGERFRFIALEPFLWFNPQIQRMLAVDPIGPFMVPAIALHISQVQKAQPKASGPFVRRQPFQPVCIFLVLITQHWTATITRLADLIGSAGQRDADSVICERIHGHLTPPSLTGHCRAMPWRAVDGLSAFSSACLGSLGPVTFTFAVQQVVLHAHLSLHALQATVLLRHVRSPLSSDQWRTKARSQTSKTHPYRQTWPAN